MEEPKHCSDVWNNVFWSDNKHTQKVTFVALFHPKEIQLDRRYRISCLYDPLFVDLQKPEY